MGNDAWVIREWRDADGHVCKAIMTPEKAARSDAELREESAAFLAAHPLPEQPSDPLAALMTDNANAYVIERASGLAVPGRPVGLADLGARLRNDDPQLARLTDQLVEDAIATVAERQRRAAP
ncbi:hypothetical protein GCM10023205_25360 [Yinghuangia aomiensis]|uniref:Uncharacterized protein n=1 Tax=Yinghuangia aomiensis TaxID=676205 RepID=A0ABP9H320_9ACTN